MLGRWRGLRVLRARVLGGRRSWLGRVGLVAVVAVALLGLTGCVADPPPLIGLATAGNGQATVSWQAPLAAPAPITGYVVTPVVDLMSQTPVVFNSTATTEIVTGLTNGTTYRFQVAAINTRGDESAWSDPSNSVTPSMVIPVATAVAAGGQHTCALLTGGAVKCWGFNSSGQLGDSTTTASLLPAAVSGITTATAIAAGANHTCVLLTGGTVDCWGNNLRGQLGNGTTTASSTPVAGHRDHHRHRDHRRRRAHLRPAGWRHRQMLGLEHRRAARQRHHHRLAHPGRGHRDHHRYRHRRRRRSHLRRARGRHRQVLG